MQKKLKNLFSRKHVDPILVVLILMAGAYFLLRYSAHPMEPTPLKNGWFGFFDQGSYLDLARTLADRHFGLLKQTYTFGLGYPLVAVIPLVLGNPLDPFKWFNLLTFVTAVAACYQFGKHFISTRAGFLAAFGLAFASPLVEYTVQPWNSTVTLFALAILMLFATLKRTTILTALTAGLLVGWVFAARYIDVVWLGLLALTCLYRSGLTIKRLAVLVVVMGVGLSVTVGGVLYSHYKVLGSPFKTPYTKHIGLGTDTASDQAASSYGFDNIGNDTLGIFVSPKLAGSKDEQQGLLMGMAWVLAAIPGFYFLIRDRRSRLVAATMLGIFIVSSLFYLSFRASTAEQVKYGVLHYFKFQWPLLAVAAAAGFERLFTQERLSAK